MLTRLFILITILCSSSFAVIRPAEVLIICNADISESLDIAQYYASKRLIPSSNIIKLHLGPQLKDTISRNDYERYIENTIRLEVDNRQKNKEKVSVLVTIWGVPFRIDNRPTPNNFKLALEKIQNLKNKKTAELNQAVIDLNRLSGQPIPETAENQTENLDSRSTIKKANIALNQASDKYLKSSDTLSSDYYQSLRLIYNKVIGRQMTIKAFRAKFQKTIILNPSELIELKQAQDILVKAEKEKWDYNKKLVKDYYSASEELFGLGDLIQRLIIDTESLKGKETGSALDSELSMIMFEPYDLYRWQENELSKRLFWFDVKTLVVARLDGPTADIARHLVDKALAGEKKRLRGKAYFDSRGYAGNKDHGMYEIYDTCLINAAKVTKSYGIETILDESSELFPIGSCPDTALYCGWYGLKNYTPAFTFTEGAIGYHIASFEAVNLRGDSNKEWVPNMLKDGITATIGPVAEPYLNAFPKPDEFFKKLLDGKTLGEAYFLTNQCNSWMMLLIGDPLYCPFGG